MIGIYGGTFNPIHYGHLRTAVEVNELFALTELRLLPCSVPAHRENPNVSALMRLEMLNLAVQSYPQLKVDTREIKREGISYMVDSLAELRKEFSNQPILLFIGTDAFNGLSSWHRWQELFHYAHIVVMTRPQFTPVCLSDFYKDRHVMAIESLKSCTSGKIYFQKVRELDISATDIRNNFLQKRSSSFLLPESIIEYIRAHNLYSA